MHSSPSDLLESLLKLGYLSPDDLKEIQEVATSGGMPLLEAALLGNRLHFDARGWILAETIGIPFLEVEPDFISLDLADVFPEAVAREYLIAPISREGNRLTVAVADPFRHMAFSVIEEMTGMSVRVVVCPRGRVSEIIARLYPEQNDFAFVNITGGAITKEEAHDWLSMGGMRCLVERIFINCATRDITGLRIYPLGKKLVVDGRTANGSSVRILSGLLNHREEVKKVILDLTSAAEHPSGLSEKVFSIETSTGVTAYCASFIRGLSGPEVIVKIIPEMRAGISLDNIGLSAEQFDITRKVLEHGSGVGMSLVSSPSSEGRATTLYAMLRHVYSPGLRVVTVEERHCFRTEGYIQILRSQVEGGFGGSLSLLAESLEPDILMVESISDQNDLVSLIHLAEKGVNVLCGIRCLNFEQTLRAILMLDMDPFTLAHVMRLAMHQRLVKLLCMECRRAVPAKPSLRQMGKRRAELERIVRDSDFYLPAGCQNCGGTGYSGKMAIIELVPFTPGVENIVVSDMDLEEKLDSLFSEDFYPAVESVCDLLRRGMITYEDVLPFLH